MPLKTVSSSPLHTLPKELEEEVATLQLPVLDAMLAVSADEQADHMHSVRCSPSLPSFLHEHSACSTSHVEVLEERQVLNERCLPGECATRSAATRSATQRAQATHARRAHKHNSARATEHSPHYVFTLCIALRSPGILPSWWLRPSSTWLTVSPFGRSTLLFFPLRTKFLLACLQ